MANTIQTTKKFSRKLSLAVGILSFSAFIIQGLSQTWGFEGVGEQIVQTILLFSGGINIYFAGNTAQKNIQEKNDEKNG